MHYHSMTHCRAVLICALMIFFVQSVLNHGYAQQPSSVETSASQLQFNNGPKIQPHHQTVAARFLRKATQRADGWDSKKQIQVKIKMLLLSDELRAAVYEQLDSDSIKIESQGFPESDPPKTLASSGTGLQSKRKVTTTSCVATSVLTSQLHDAILARVAQSAGSQTASSPTLILLDGNEGQLDDFVQRPFVVGLPPSQPGANRNESEAVGNSEHDRFTGSPDIQVVDEGNSFRVQATIREGVNLHLASEITRKQLVGVEEVEILGFQVKTVLQRPVHQVQSAVVAADMKSGQTLLVDPYMSSTIERKAEQAVPLLNKIPYLSQAFKNTSAAVTKTNLLVLIQPQIQTSTVQQASATEPIKNR